jgi:hypothetical protein
MESKQSKFKQSLNRAGYSKYADYLKSSHWQSTRRKMYNSKLPKACYACGSKGPLDIHHRTYKRLGEERLTDLKFICRRCHDELHQMSKLKPSSPLWSITAKFKRQKRGKMPKAHNADKSLNWMKDFYSVPGGKQIEPPKKKGILDYFM